VVGSVTFFAPARWLLACLALYFMGWSSAQAQPADQKLGDFLRLSQYGSPYAGAQFPEQWCYYAKVDKDYDWWYLTDAVSGVLGAVQAQNGFGIPFVFDNYGTPLQGAIIVGYVIDGGPPLAPLDPVSPPAANTADCAVGERILTGGPYPIVGLAKNFASQAVVDPAPEYRLWSMGGKFHRVRWVMAIPVSFLVGSNLVAGRIVVAFTGDW
jgi:hypothetical protein